MAVFTPIGKASKLFVNHNGAIKEISSGWVGRNGSVVPFYRKGGGGTVRRFKWQCYGYYNNVTRATYNRLILNPSEIKKIKISGSLKSSSTGSGSGSTCNLNLVASTAANSLVTIKSLAATNSSLLLNEIVVDFDTDIDWTKYDRTKQVFLYYDNTSTYNTNTADLDLEIETFSGNEFNVGAYFSGQGYSSSSPYNRLIVLDAGLLKQVQISGSMSASLLSVYAVKNGASSFGVVTSSLNPSTSTIVPIPDWTVYEPEKGMMLRVGAGTTAQNADISYNLKW